MGLDRADCLHLIFCQQAPVITVDNALDEFLLNLIEQTFILLLLRKSFKREVAHFQDIFSLSVSIAVKIQDI